MRDKHITRDFYVKKLGFAELGNADFKDYFMCRKDSIEIHFFLYRELDPKDNYGQIYIRTDNIKDLYEDCIKRGITIHPNAPLQAKPWGQMEFSIIDPDTNLITFGQRIS